MKDPTTVFSSRVEDYVKYRPGYPRALIELLHAECRWRETAVVADVGSGTGLLSRLFLDAGNAVYGVEPNVEMRAAAEALLRGYRRFVSLDGRAEATGLDAQSVDQVAAGQAFHWFEGQATRREFARILRPGGWVVLAWNTSRTTGTPFLVDYQRFWATYLQGLSPDQERPDILTPFFGAGRFVETVVGNDDNAQVFDLEALKGRIMSSSAAPQAGQPRHREMIAALEDMFRRHQRDGTVTIEYDTVVVYGQLARD